MYILHRDRCCFTADNVFVIFFIRQELRTQKNIIKIYSPGLRCFSVYIYSVLAYTMISLIATSYLCKSMNKSEPSISSDQFTVLAHSIFCYKLMVKKDNIDEQIYIKGCIIRDLDIGYSLYDLTILKEKSNIKV